MGNPTGERKVAVLCTCGKQLDWPESWFKGNPKFTCPFCGYQKNVIYEDLPSDIKRG